MNKIMTLLLLIFFLAQIGYISYFLPQVVIKGLDFPEDIKLSMILAGICIGLMYFLKPKEEKKDEKE